MNYDLSILIPTHKRPTEFNYLITTLLMNLPEESDFTWEIVVLDNDPIGKYTYRCIELLNKYTDLDTSKVHIYKGMPGLTEIWFRPQLMRLAQGKYHWFIDDDCIIDTYGFTRLMDDLVVLGMKPIEFTSNQLFYEGKLYTKVYDLNLYDIIYDSTGLNPDTFNEMYSDFKSYKVGGDKKLLEFIMTSEINLHRYKYTYNTIVNLYRKNGDNLMLNI